MQHYNLYFLCTGLCAITGMTIWNLRVEDKPHQHNTTKNGMGPCHDNQLQHKTECQVMSPMTLDWTRLAAWGNAASSMTPYLDDFAWQPCLSNCQMNAAGMMVKVTINGKEYMAILDSRTIVDLMAHHLVMELGLPICQMGSPLALEVAGAAMMMPLGEVTFNLGLVTGWTSMPCTTLVISDSGDTLTIASVILGVWW